MKLRICHLYPELLNMYGDVGNVKILKRRAEARGILVEVTNLSAGEAFDKAQYDIVMLGGGQDFEMGIVSRDMVGEKKEALRAYMEEEGVFLAVGSGYQMLGKSYYSSGGEETEGLGLLPFATEKSEARFVGNIAVEIGGDTCVGFENHLGKTNISGLAPLGRVLSGFGNNGEDGEEGLRYKNTCCTFLHGPFLAKSPEFADKLLLTALKKRYDLENLVPLDDTNENKAREVILKNLGI